MAYLNTLLYGNGVRMKKLLLCLVIFMLTVPAYAGNKGYIYRNYMQEHKKYRKRVPMPLKIKEMPNARACFLIYAGIFIIICGVGFSIKEIIKEAL